MFLKRPKEAACELKALWEFSPNATRDENHFTRSVGRGWLLSPVGLWDTPRPIPQIIIILGLVAVVARFRETVNVGPTLYRFRFLLITQEECNSHTDCNGDVNSLGTFYFILI